MVSNVKKQVVDAVFENGVLRPQGELRLHEHERVRVTVEPVSQTTPEEAAAAMGRFEAGVRRMNFRSSGKYPSRDELHERR